MSKMMDALEAPAMTFEIECVGPDGQVKWRETVRNLVMTAGKTDIIDKYLKGSAYTAAWYLILKGAGSIAAGDTLASHGGWTESTPYSGNRPAITWGTTSGGSNTATAVSLPAGAFLAALSTAARNFFWVSAAWDSKALPNSAPVPEAMS